MDKTKIMEFFKSKQFKGIIAIIAAIIMYYSPENTSKIIEALLSAAGISTLIISEKSEKKNRGSVI